MAEEGKPPGWRVEGSPKQPKKRPPGLGRRLLIFVGVLLALNWLTVALFAPGKKERVQIPYSPTFLAQVTSDNVASISSRGATLQGTFRRRRYDPPSEYAGLGSCGDPAALAEKLYRAASPV